MNKIYTELENFYSEVMDGNDPVYIRGVIASGKSVLCLRFLAVALLSGRFEKLTILAPNIWSYKWLAELNIPELEIIPLKQSTYGQVPTQADSQKIFQALSEEVSAEHFVLVDDYLDNNVMLRPAPNVKAVFSYAIYPWEKTIPEYFQGIKYISFLNEVPRGQFVYHHEKHQKTVKHLGRVHPEDSPTIKALIKNSFTQ